MGTSTTKPTLFLFLPLGKDNLFFAVFPRFLSQYFLFARLGQIKAQIVFVLSPGPGIDLGVILIGNFHCGQDHLANIQMLAIFW